MLSFYHDTNMFSDKEHLESFSGVIDHYLSAPGAYLQFPFKFSEKSSRSLTPPCYVSSQDMTKNNSSFSHIACPEICH